MNYGMARFFSDQKGTLVACVWGTKLVQNAKIDQRLDRWNYINQCFCGNIAQLSQVASCCVTTKPSDELLREETHHSAGCVSKRSCFLDLDLLTEAA